MSAPSEDVPSKPTIEAEEQQESEQASGSGVEPNSKDTPYDEQDEKKEGDEEEDEEEEETCGFCIFMKGGGCKDAFVNWSKCVDRERDAGNDFTEECREATMRLRECMLEHRDYYQPLLEEEEAEMEAARKAAAEAVAEAAGAVEATEAATEETRTETEPDGKKE